MDESVTSPDQNASAKAEESQVALPRQAPPLSHPHLTTPETPGFRPVAAGVWLDHRLALVHPQQGWLAVADLHYGYDLRRRRQGALLPDWGGSELEDRLLALLHDHQPRSLILIGDIMDGTASVDESLAFLERLRRHVPTLIPLRGNHDRPGLHHRSTFKPHHHEPGFFFHHGHEPMPSHFPIADTIIITAHHHPAVQIRDGAGLSLKFPALIREGLPPENAEQWVVPAFSPWAAGGHYQSPHPRLATWLCALNRVWSPFANADA